MKEQQPKSSVPVYLYQFSFDGPAAAEANVFPSDIHLPGDIPCLSCLFICARKSIHLRGGGKEDFKKYALNMCSVVKRY